MNGSIASPDVEGLEAFANRTDRAPAMFFVGREFEIAEIEGACQRALGSVKGAWKEKTAGETRIVQGAPGAGKSALLSHLRKCWAADDAAPDAVELDLSVLDSMRSLAEAIVKAVAPDRVQQFKQTVNENFDADAAVFGLRTGIATGMTLAPPYPSLDVVAEMLPPHEWKRPLSLMFDEAQDISSPQVRVLRPLHLAIHKLPVVPVLAGLANTRSVANARGLSRIADGATYTLAPLPDEDVVHAVEMLLDEFHVDRAGADIDWPAELATRSNGWPQHLTVSMQALARGLVEANGRLEKVDGRAVQVDGRKRRENYYWERVSDEMEDAKELVREVMRWLPDKGETRGKVLAYIKATDAALPESGLPEGMTAKVFRGHLIGKGALQSNGRGKLVCPIPSFHDFLMRGFEMAPEPDPKPLRRLPPRKRQTDGDRSVRFRSRETHEFHRN